VSRARIVVGVGLLGMAAVAAVAYARSVESVQAGQGGAPEYEPQPGMWDSITSAAYDLGNEVSDMYNSRPALPEFSAWANVQAFLGVLRRSEGTAQAPDPYRVCYGYRHTVQNMADHPAVTGEWRGERLSDAQCREVGLSSGCVSTAAGAYQMIRPTWVGLRDRLRLPDFSAQSQDAAAVQLLRDCGAFARLEVGDLAGAIKACNRRGLWASLPGFGLVTQPTRGMETVSAWYTGAGGYIA
jgi:lysozyme